MLKAVWEQNPSHTPAGLPTNRHQQISGAKSRFAPR